MLDDEFVAIGRADLAPLKARVGTGRPRRRCRWCCSNPRPNTRRLVDRWFAAEGACSRSR